MCMELCGVQEETENGVEVDRKGRKEKYRWGMKGFGRRKEGKRTVRGSNWSRKQGHRQPYTRLLIEEIKVN